jgi:hypothetical protein
MEDAFKAEGRMLTHLIGPGVEHKYEPETLKALLKRIDVIVEKGRDKTPNEVHLQSRTLRYPKQNWVQAAGLEEHWKDARIDAIQAEGVIKVQTKNIKVMQFVTPDEWSLFKYFVDGQPLGTGWNLPGAHYGSVPKKSGFTANTLTKEPGGGWRWGGANETRKIPMRQGPIDDAFMSSFIVVTPTGQSRNPAFQKWCDAELQHFRERWRSLMRGELPEVKDTQFNGAKLAHNNLILWGDAQSNIVIAGFQGMLPVKFNGKRWSLGETTYEGDRFAPVCISPADDTHFPMSSYIVLNSGLTFREAHDRTNSQQNSKLPDWAIIDISQPPDANAPGRIHDADFFDENWQLKRQPKAP